MSLLVTCLSNGIQHEKEVARSAGLTHHRHLGEHPQLRGGDVVRPMQSPVTDKPLPCGALWSSLRLAAGFHRWLCFGMTGIKIQKTKNRSQSHPHRRRSCLYLSASLIDTGRCGPFLRGVEEQGLVRPRISSELLAESAEAEAYHFNERAPRAQRLRLAFSVARVSSTLLRGPNLVYQEVAAVKLNLAGYRSF